MSLVVHRAVLEVELLEDRNAPATISPSPAAGQAPASSDNTAPAQTSQTGINAGPTNALPPSTAASQSGPGNGSVSPGPTDAIPPSTAFAQVGINNFSTGGTPPDQSNQAGLSNIAATGSLTLDQLNSLSTPSGAALFALGPGLGTPLSPVASVNPVFASSAAGTNPLSNTPVSTVNLSGLAPFRPTLPDQTGINGISPFLPTYDLDYTRVGPFYTGSGTPANPRADTPPAYSPIDVNGTPETEASVPVPEDGPVPDVYPLNR